MWLHRNGFWVQPLPLKSAREAEREKTPAPCVTAAPQTESRTSAPRCTWAASTSAIPKTPSFNFFHFHPSLRLAPSPPPTSEALFLVLDNRACRFLFVLLPFSYFLNSGHDPLDVILRPAPGLGADRPARHCRGGYNILKARRQFRHNANSRAHRRATAHAHTSRDQWSSEGGGGGGGRECTAAAALCMCVIEQKRLIAVCKVPAAEENKSPEWDHCSVQPAKVTPTNHNSKLEMIDK